MASHQKMNLFMSRLTEPQRRWYAGTLSQATDRTDVDLARIIGLDEKTIHRGRLELESCLADQPVAAQRRPGGGRWRAQKKTQI
jgi:hypothetical protein